MDEAIAYRDYHSNASVEVRLFADRLEVWNPGTLPGTLTPESLRTDHPSVPNNPLLAESLYLARYIEKAGSGTQAMIELCREAGLPEPSYELRQGSFVLTLWRDWLTDEVLADFDLSSRQRLALAHVKSAGFLTNLTYREIANTSERTALRELQQLTTIGLLEKIGETGRATRYVIAKFKPAKGMTPGTRHEPAKRAIRRRLSGSLIHSRIVPTRLPVAKYPFGFSSMGRCG